MKRYIEWSIAILFLLLALPVLADTTWVAAGTVQGMWTPTRSPFMIHSGDVEIPVGASLTLLAGVDVVFTGPYRLIVHGELYGYGREDDSIRFTTDTLANPGRWRGIFAQSAVCSLRYCIIENAESPAGQNGGGLSATLGRVDLAFCSVRNNSTALSGGGVYGDQCTALNIRDSELSDNRASSGGAFYCRRTPALVTRSRILGNLASVSGGGLYGTRSHWLIYRCWIADNRASTSHGGGVRSDSGNVRLFNSVVLRNHAGLDGGGYFSRADTNDAVIYTNFLSNFGRHGAAIYCMGRYSHFGNSIIANSSGGAAIYFDQSDGLELCYCDVYENTGGNYAGSLPPGLGELTTNNLLGIPCDEFMNISADVGFQDGESDDFHLISSSPCIGTAHPSSVDNDFDGIPRPNPANTRPDIGAFESGDGVAVRNLRGNLRGILEPGLYTVGENVTVLTNDTLIIQPGTRILFGNGSGMSVSGLLQAIGNEASPIIFSVLNDYPQRTWSGLRFVGCQQNCELAYCTIEQAHSGSNVTCDSCGPHLSHCKIQDGLSYQMCPGLRCLNGADPVLEHCRISRNIVWNSTTERGGGVYSEASSPSFSFCRIDSNLGSIGGGITAYNSNVTLQNCHIDYNWASRGCGCVFEFSTVLISSSNIDSNRSNWDCNGGGVFANGSTITVQNTHIGNNSVKQGSGCYFQSSTVSLSSSVVEYNINMWSDWGSGIFANNSTLTARDCQISRNIGGGGIGCEFLNCNVTMVATAIEQNHSVLYGAQGSGGGIYAWSDSQHMMLLDSCSICNNFVYEEGGGIRISGLVNALIRHCVLVDNVSDGSGGGIRFMNNMTGSESHIEKCVIYNNSVSGIVSDDRTINVNSSIIANNQGGPGIRFTQRLLTGRILENCDFWGNTGGPMGSLDSLPPGLGVLSTTNFNGDSCDAFNNIFFDPAFVDTATRDLHLMPSSRCIDAGDPALSRDPDSSYTDIGPYWQIREHGLTPFHLVSPPDQTVWPTDIVRFSWEAAMPPDSQADIHYDLHVSIAGIDSIISAEHDTVAFVDVGATYPDSAQIIWWIMAHRFNPDATTRSMTTRMLRFRPSRIRNISLLSPADQDTVRSDTIRFCWSSSEHPRRPVFIIYQLYLQGSGIDSAFPIQLDTCLRVILRPNSPPQSAWLQWHVTAYSSDPDSSFTSLDTSNFYYERPDAIEPVREIIPTQFALHAAYPNPFNATTTIIYDIPKSAPAKIRIFDITGREVKKLIDGQQEAGQHRIVFHGADLASGIYFVRMEAGSFSQTRKIVLLK